MTASEYPFQLIDRSAVIIYYPKPPLYAICDDFRKNVKERSLEKEREK